MANGLSGNKELETEGTEDGTYVHFYTEKESNEGFGS